MSSREAGGQQERTDTLCTLILFQRRLVSEREVLEVTVSTHIWVLQIQWEMECIAWEQKSRIALNYSKGHLD